MLIVLNELWAILPFNVGWGPAGFGEVACYPIVSKLNCARRSFSSCHSMPACALAQRLSIQMRFPYAQTCSGKVAIGLKPFCAKSMFSESLFLLTQI